MNLTAKMMLSAFEALDEKLRRPVRLIVGGGGAMLLAHKFSLTTTDIDAVPASGVTIDELSPMIKAVADELRLPPDWLNPYYSTFAHVLPRDYGTRLIDVAKFTHLTVSALSKEDLLIMKCFAARQKDVVHARALFRAGADTGLVRNQIEALDQKRIPGADRAKKFLAEIEAFFADRDEP